MNFVGYCWSAVRLSIACIVNYLKVLSEVRFFHANYALELAGRTHRYPLFWFVVWFVFRYLRLLVHIVSFWCYRPAPITQNPKYGPKDCTIILPTIDPENGDFRGCLESCLANGPHSIYIVTVGTEKAELCLRTIEPFRLAWPSTNIEIVLTDVANKRRQVARAIPLVETAITVLLDDHVFWPSYNFLQTAIAPFEDEKVGAVGTNKRVLRTETGFNMASFWNMLGAIYLERHNFEIRATNAIDGGVFVISGRTSLHRSSILQDPAFLQGFKNERFFFGKFGPINPDDDNFITRWEVKHGWDIKVQYCKDAMILTTLGTYPKFLDQCLRWVRTTWRSNSASLFTDRTVWIRQPWCVYAVYLSSFFNFALFNDFGLMATLYNSPYGNKQSVKYLATWIFCTKMVKLVPYFLRHPGDLMMLPGYFVFAYYHSLLKLYALFTFWNCHWGGRDLAAINDATLLKTNGGDDDNDDVDIDNHDNRDSKGNSDDRDSPRPHKPGKPSAHFYKGKGHRASSSTSSSSSSSSSYYSCTSLNFSGYNDYAVD